MSQAANPRFAFGAAPVLVVEPPRTRYDLHFRLAGFPVRIHPAFWLITAILGFNSEQLDAVELLLWVVVVFVSILVHELGHALAVRKFGWVSRIVLYHLGGLATIESPHEAFLGNEEELPPKSKILIAAAGPAAGFLLAGVVIAGLFAAPIHFGVARNNMLGLWFTHDYDGNDFPVPASKLNDDLRILENKAKQPQDGDDANATDDPKYQEALSKLRQRTHFSPLNVNDPVQVYESARQAVAEYARHRRLGVLIGDILFVNIFWGLINLLPVIPLDGGQIARELYGIRHPRTATEKALLLSTIVGGIVAALGLWHFATQQQWSTGIFFALMFGLLAFINYRMLRQIRQMGGMGGPDDYGGYEPEDWWKR